MDEEYEHEHDRAARESIADFLSNSGSGQPGPALDGSGGPAVAADGKPVRQSGGSGFRRNLLPTFRIVPGDQASAGPGPDRALASSDPGFPGTRAFSLSARRPDPRAPGPALPAASVGPDRAPAALARSDDPAGRGAAIQPTGPAAASVGPVVATAEGGAGGRIRGRRTGSAAGGGAKKQAKESPAKPVALPKEIAKLVSKGAPAAVASPPRLIPTESERADARRLFREIGERFNANRKKSKTAAYAGYRHDLMANLDTLVMGGALDLKDATTIITNLEQFTKETEAESTETPATVLGRWLRMDASEIAGLGAEVVAEPMVANEVEGEDEGAEEDTELAKD